MMTAASANSAPHLQPLGVGELLDRAIRIYRKNFLALVGIVAVVQTPLVALQLIVSLVSFTPAIPEFPFSPTSPPPDNPFDLLTPTYFLGLLATFVIGLFTFFLMSLAWAAAARLTADSYLRNERLTILGAYDKITASAPRLLLTLLVVLAAGLALLIWTLIPCLGWFTGVGMWLYGIWVIYPLIIISCVLEGQGVGGSFRRAWDLVRRRFWWTLGFVFLLVVFGIAVTLGPSVVVGAILGVIFNADIFADNPRAVYILQTTIQSITSLATYILYSPIQMVSMTLVYFDLRVRTEGFDLALSTAGAEAGAGDILAQAPPPESGSPITGKELGYFALISFGLTLPFILFYVCIVAFIIFLGVAAAGSRF